MNLDTATHRHQIGWEWYKLLAQQRMQLVSFWFVAMSFLVTGAVVAFSEEQLAAAGVVAGAIAGSSLVFYYFDVRTQELVERGERLLIAAERELRAFDYPQEIELVTGMHHRGSWKSYGRLLGVLYLGTAAFGCSSFFTLLALELSS